jgi:hypothetical protein
LVLEYHGDGLGPEIAPWRKKAKKRNRARCDHKFSQWYDTESFWPHSTERKIIERPDGFTRTRSTKYYYGNRYCLNCRKREYHSKYEYTYTHYHYDKIIFQHTVTEDWKTR